MIVREIISRVKSNWGLKILLGAVLTIGFAGIYFGLLQRHQFFPITTMKISWIDRLIPCIPDAVYLYESLWLLMPIAPWLTKTRNELGRYCLSFCIMSMVGFCIFFFFPTRIPRPSDIQDTNALYESLIVFDKGINACPSFHAAFAVFHGACCHVIFRTISAGDKWIRWFIWIWASGILASTLLTKQHVFVDIPAGALLGLGGFAIFNYRADSISPREVRPCERESY